MENLLQSTNLVRRAYWLVRLRWFGAILLAGATFIASHSLKVTLPVSALYLTAGGIAVYNFLLLDLLNYCTWHGKTPSPKVAGRIITFQISADLFILTLILHFSGGIENPFYFYFVMHMIIASILVSRVQSYFQATLAVILFGGLALLENKGLITHYTLKGFVIHSHYEDNKFVLGTLAIFTSTLYLVVYMTTSICEILRRQQEVYENTNKLLEKKDKLKNEYVVRLTHDIKGHLSAIQSCLGIVAGKMVGSLNDKQSDMVERAMNRTDKCLAFIEALLRLTKMKLSGELDIQKFSLKRYLFNALTSAENKASKKSIRLDFSIENGIDEIYGEPILIEEMLMNLLFNAVKYTPSGGEVKLKVEDKGENIEIGIADNGIGIPEKDIEAIFEEFYRAANAREIERDETGLGLSIARQVVERHGGRIWAENNPDRGSTFTLLLPKTPKQMSGHT